MTTKFPVFFGVTRDFDSTCIERPAAEIDRRFEALLPVGTTRLAGKTVAVCVGSRGIASLPELVRATIDNLRVRGANVFIVPTMGSHGGGTAEGQREVLRNLGITEESMGVEIHASMDTTDICTLPNGPTVRFATDGLKADHVVPVCRVKEHTMLGGEVQSGLCKMLVIGCGKHAGASEYHQHDIEKTLVPSAKAVIEHVPLLCGVAVVENAYDKVCAVRVVRKEDFIETDKKLLRLAKNTLPRLPLDTLDALLIDEIGKEISGSGADVNVIGKWRRDGGPRVPDYKTIALFGITPASHGNATGIGNMDIMPRRILDILDYNATRINVLTSKTYRTARLPLHVEDDRAVLEAVLATVAHPENITMARIRNTLALQRFWLTESAVALLTPAMRCTVDATPQPCTFDSNGVLQAFR